MRNDRIDALRAIAALGIIALHIPQYPELPADLVAALRGLLRWCVPFFFMVTGYYLTRPGDALPRFARRRLLGLVLLTTLANLLYLPIGLWRYGELMGAGQALFIGTWYHLWYLNSLLMSAMLIEALGRHGHVALARGLGLAIALGFGMTSAALAFGHGSELTNATLRQFLGLPCLLIGAALHRARVPRLRRALAVLGLGIALLLGEMAAVHALGGSWMLVQWSIGTAVMTVGVFVTGLAANWRVPGALARWGRDEALGIYLFHPALIIAAGAILTGRLASVPQGAPGLALLVLTGLLSILLMRALALLGDLWPGRRSAAQS